MADEDGAGKKQTIFEEIMGLPGLPDTYKNLTSVLEEISKERKKEAKASIDDKFRMGVEHRKKGKHDRAVQLLRKVVEKRGAPEDYSQLGLALINLALLDEKKKTQDSKLFKEGIGYLRRVANERGTHQDHYQFGAWASAFLHVFGDATAEEEKSQLYEETKAHIDKLDPEFIKRTPGVQELKSLLEEQIEKAEKKRKKREVQAEFEREKVREYTLIEKIGDGELCTVAKAEDDNGEKVAVKLLKNRWSISVSDAFLDAVRKFRGLKSKRIPIEIAHGIGPYLIIEFFEEPWESLDKVQKPMPLFEAVNLAKEVALALEELHQHGIIHGCIGTGDVFYNTKTHEVKVANAGLNEVLRKGEAEENYYGDFHPHTITIELGKDNPPIESFQIGYKSSSKSDVNSLGMLIYHILTGEGMQARNPTSDTMQEIFATSKVKMAMNGAYPYMPKNLVKLVVSMLGKDPAKRPPISQVALKLDKEAFKISHYAGTVMKSFNSRYRQLEEVLAKKSRKYGATPPEDIKAIQEKAAELRDYANKMGISRFVERKMEQIEKTIERRKKADDVVTSKAQIPMFYIEIKKLADESGLSVAEVKEMKEVYEVVRYSWFLSDKEPRTFKIRKIGK